MTSPRIHFLPQDLWVPFDQETSVLEVALRNGIELSHSCGGMGSCTTCRIFIESSPTPLPARTEIELEISEPRGFQEFERLSCQLPPLPGLIVRIPEEVT